MGWDFTRGASKKEIIAECVKCHPRHRASDWSNQLQKIVECDYFVTTTTLDYYCYGNQLWAIIEIKKEFDNKITKTEIIIVLYLLSKKRNFGWGYKPMSESMGPFYYNCPLEFLNKTSETCKEWREEVKRRNNELVSL